MKKYIILIFSLVLGTIGCKNETKEPNHETHQHEEKKSSSDQETKKPLSPRLKAMSNIGNTHVHIDYSSPGVRGRTVWNGLVAYDQVWVTGAHKATSIDFSTDVKINETIIKKGKYAFFTIPGKDEWTVILNQNYNQHLADNYDPNLDVLRVMVNPIALNEVVESLTYEVKSDNNSMGKICMSWEKILIELPVESVKS